MLEHLKGKGKLLIKYGKGFNFVNMFTNISIRSLNYYRPCHWYIIIP